MVAAAAAVYLLVAWAPFVDTGVAVNDSRQLLSGRYEPSAYWPLSDPQFGDALSLAALVMTTVGPIMLLLLILLGSGAMIGMIRVRPARPLSLFMTLVAVCALAGLLAVMWSPVGVDITEWIAD